DRDEARGGWGETNREGSWAGCAAGDFPGAGLPATAIHPRRRRTRLL
ncbi:MAG: hypothetical protein AVDCRST_MAG01-01-1209, partial [uncultured Rubrobacteraceae bacterium]